MLPALIRAAAPGDVARAEKNKLAFVFVGAILEEASPQETRMFLAQPPTPARTLWRLFGARIYGRSRDRIRLSVQRASSWRWRF